MSNVSSIQQPTTTKGTAPAVTKDYFEKDKHIILFDNGMKNVVFTNKQSGQRECTRYNKDGAILAFGKAGGPQKKNDDRQDNGSFIGKAALASPLLIVGSAAAFGSGPVLVAMGIGATGLALGTGLLFGGCMIRDAIKGDAP